MRATQWLEEFRDDVTFALRQLRRTPAFTLVAALTLALGIGANSAIFALVDATLLRPLPYRDAERLVTVWERTDTTPRGFASPPNLIDWKTQNRSFDFIAAYNDGRTTLTGGFEPEELVGTKAVDFTHPDDVDGLRRKMDALRRGEDSARGAATRQEGPARVLRT